MRAHAVVKAVSRGGGTAFETLRSEPPLLLRATPDRLLVVGGAAGPLGGDELRITIHIEPGAKVSMGSVAASIALPGNGPSSLEMEVNLGSGAQLEWVPEPLIVAYGCDHIQNTIIRMAADASLRWRESIVFGRSGEAPGALDTTLRVERAGVAIYHQQLQLQRSDVESQWNGPAGLWGAATVGGDLFVNRSVPEETLARLDPPRVTLFEVAERAWLLSEVGAPKRPDVQMPASTRSIKTSSMVETSG